MSDDITPVSHRGPVMRMLNDFHRIADEPEPGHEEVNAADCFNCQRIFDAIEPYLNWLTSYAERIRNLLAAERTSIRDAQATMAQLGEVMDVLEQQELRLRSYAWRVVTNAQLVHVQEDSPHNDHYTVPVLAIQDLRQVLYEQGETP